MKSTIVGSCIGAIAGNIIGSGIIRLIDTFFPSTATAIQICLTLLLAAGMVFACAMICRSTKDQ